ncbi:MAG: hypothetical protein MI922_04400 [Bacteroidales bacterium]|nr:hypothetical protein [Bacteroidales bacterium]
MIYKLLVLLSIIMLFNTSIYSQAKHSDMKEVYLNLKNDIHNDLIATKLQRMMGPYTLVPSSVEVEEGLNFGKAHIPFDTYTHIKFSKSDVDSIVSFSIIDDYSYTLDGTPCEQVIYYSSKHQSILIPPIKPNRNFKIDLVSMDSNSIHTTKTYHFTTRNKKAGERVSNNLDADIGVAAFHFKDGDKDFFKISPIFSISYYPRAVNKSLPVNTAYKLWDIRRFSATMGVSLSGIEEENVRENLTGNVNLLLGGGWKLNDAIRLSAGWVFFNEINPNRLYSHQKNLAWTPYYSIHFDMDFKDLLGGIVSTLGFK